VKSSDFRLDRRRFLAASASAPLLLRLLQQPAAYAETAPQHAPYLKLAPFIAPGADDFPGEAQATQAEQALRDALSSKALPVADGFTGSSLIADDWNEIASGISMAVFHNPRPDTGAAFQAWVHSLGEINRAQFFVLPGDRVRFEVSSRAGGGLLYSTGMWNARWNGSKLLSLSPIEETRASADQPWFRDVTGTVLAGSPVLIEQLSRGVPYWRGRLDPAAGIDIYGSNGIAVGDIDGDGFDEIYVCQPGGLPNRLLRFHDGRLEDLSEAWDVALLDETSAALFVDLRNTGRQDLVVLRSSGPLLYLNDGAKFRLRDDAFRFATVPGGGFTGIAAADYDRDGRLDLYLCTYVYFQSEAQYTYPVPYHDAQNGPPNFLFRNLLNEDGSGSFEDVTGSCGINENNNRFSFAPAWCDVDGSGWPDLYVANDFGRNNFYKNGGGRFRDAAAEAGIEDMAPGMSACWFDYDGDGHPDLYVGNMWSAAGQRIVQNDHFAPARGTDFAEAYRRHTKGNSLYRNRRDGRFEECTGQEHVAMGRWAWSSVGQDVDNDGNPEILIGCGMLSNESHTDLMSFFWRQVVAHSPQKAQPSPAYENGWNAINQFIREDANWNGHEPNVVHARRGNRYYDVSGITGFDFADDSRAFAITDFDGDGRPDIILKNRLGPQVRVLQNNCAGQNQSIAFELRGTKSNRDAIGAKIEVNGRAVWLSAESGYLSQHSKRILVGLGKSQGPVNVRITWPSGTTQELSALRPGYIYRVTEGRDEYTNKPFLRRQELAPKPLAVDNTPRLHTTWLVESLPLPEQVPGPALLVLVDTANAELPQSVPVRTVDLSSISVGRKASWRVFRRYLFDYRHDLQCPLSMLIDEQGRAVKVYSEVPTADAVRQDLKALSKLPSESRALPFRGVYRKQPKRDYFKFAAALLWEGQSDSALPYLHEAMRQGSANPRVPMLIGQIQLEAGHVDEAEKYVRQSLALNSSSADAWLAMGAVYDAKEDPKQALTCYEKSLALNPHSSYALLNAARASEKTGNPTQAEQWYGQILRDDANNADAANGLGLLLAKRGDIDEAKKLLQHAIEIRRDFGSAINNLGVLYLNAGQVSDAVAAFEYGLGVAPDEDILYLNLARIYMRQGEKEKARGVMERLLVRKPNNSTAVRALRELDQL
jgi:tetratricopeptide (TPR) repeat protein